MRTKHIVILVGLLLTVRCVSAQEQDISRIKTRSITLGRHVADNKQSPSQIWILVETGGSELKPVEFKGPPSRIDKISPEVVDSSSSALKVGQVQVVDLPMRRCAIAYSAFSRV